MASFRFTVGASGVNSSGNHFCKLHYYGPGVVERNTYHYYNADGSYYFRNPDGSSYFNNGVEIEEYIHPADDDNPDGISCIQGFEPGKALYPPPPCPRPNGYTRNTTEDPGEREGVWYPSVLVKEEPYPLQDDESHHEHDWYYSDEYVFGPGKEARVPDLDVEQKEMIRVKEELLPLKDESIVVKREEIVIKQETVY